jgi:hypothetical protein
MTSSSDDNDDDDSFVSSVVDWIVGIGSIDRASSICIYICTERFVDIVVRLASIRVDNKDFFVFLLSSLIQQKSSNLLIVII